MACKRSAVRSRLPPPLDGRQIDKTCCEALSDQGFIFFTVFFQGPGRSTKEWRSVRVPPQRFPPERNGLKHGRFGMRIPKCYANQGS
jgi:hypothetical protein